MKKKSIMNCFCNKKKTDAYIVIPDVVRVIKGFEYRNEDIGCLNGDVYTNCEDEIEINILMAFYETRYYEAKGCKFRYYAFYSNNYVLTFYNIEYDDGTKKCYITDDNKWYNMAYVDINIPLKTITEYRIKIGECELSIEEK